ALDPGRCGDGDRVPGHDRAAGADHRRPDAGAAQGAGQAGAAAGAAGTACVRFAGSRSPSDRREIRDALIRRPVAAPADAIIGRMSESPDKPADKPGTTHFGYRDVPVAEKQKLVGEV